MRSDSKLTKVTKSRDYARISTMGLRFPSASWVMLVLDNNGGETPAVGVVASKKIGNAVERNLAKRRMRVLVREVLAGDVRLAGCQIAMIARSRLLERDYQLLKRELRYCVAEIIKRLHHTNDDGKQPGKYNN